MEIGISTFVETTPINGVTISHDKRIRQIIEEAKLADEVGLDIYAVGEHHRADFAASNPATILAAIAAVTKNIRLTSAVTVLSSNDPIRVFQEFATVDAISNGRAEIMVGRGSFTESFPLFGYSLRDYNTLFDEKLELLLKIAKNNREVNFEGGKHTHKINGLGVYPSPVQNPLPIHIGSGGNPESVGRAAVLGLPLVLAIIGGSPLHFAPLTALYKKLYEEEGHDMAKLKISSHSHGFVWDDTDKAAELFFPSTKLVMSQIGKERGWAPYTRDTFDAARTMQGALYVGDSDYVAEKIIYLNKNVGIDRFYMHLPLGTMPHDEVMHSIELLGKKVAPKVRAAAT